MNQYEWYLELEKMTPNQLRKTMLNAYWLTMGKEQKEMAMEMWKEIQQLYVDCKEKNAQGEEHAYENCLAIIEKYMR